MFFSINMLCTIYFVIVSHVAFGITKAALNDKKGVYGFHGFYASPEFKNLNSQLKYPLTNGSDELRYYDTSGGNYTVGSAKTTSLTSDDLKCFDNVNNILYTLVMMAENTTSVDHQPMGLFGFNLSNPSMTFYIELPMLMTCANCIGATDVCISNPTTGDIYVYARSYDNPLNTILIQVTRDSTTLKPNINEIATYNNIVHPYDRISVKGFCHFFDTKRNKLWIPIWTYGTNGGLYWYSIDATTGNILQNISSSVFEEEVNGCIYDEEEDKLITIGLSERNENTDDQSYIIEFANPETLELYSNNNNIKPTEEEYCGMYHNPTYDNENKILYQLVFKMENKDDNCNDYVNGKTQLGYLIGISITDGKVETTGQICRLWDCPLSIQYWSGITG